MGEEILSALGAVESRNNEALAIHPTFSDNDLNQKKLRVKKIRAIEDDSPDID